MQKLMETQIRKVIRKPHFDTGFGLHSESAAAPSRAALPPVTIFSFYEADCSLISLFTCLSSIPCHCLASSAFSF